MCLSIPAKIISIDKNKALANVNGIQVEIGLDLVEDIKEGNYVLVHTGFALQKISLEEAEEGLKILKELRLDEIE